MTFNKGLIDSLCDVVAAVKPQCAYYEMYGWQGVKALYDTIAYAKEKGLFVITDGKRNDIGTTMEAYAAAHIGKTEAFGKTFESFSADALTVNGYLGSDGINPLLNVCKEEDKGIFVLVKLLIHPPASFRTDCSATKPSTKPWVKCARTGARIL